MDNKKRLTTDFGAPVPDDLHSRTAGQRGPTLMEDVHLLKKLAHFDRERIPERVVHAKGAGAGGYFELTKDMSQYTCAKLFSQVGKKTEVFVRFSTVGGEKGSADAERDPRGFAVKFYTEDGNYDLVGNNTPVFFIRDALKFPDFIHTQKKHPQTGFKDPTMQWDFWSLTPESMHQVMILFSDRGIPATYRNMNGYGSHTFRWYNEKGQYWWVKYHFKTDQGNKTLTHEEAEVIKGKNPDHALEDLYKAVTAGDFPSWTLQVQIMTPEQAASFPYDVFDVTKVWPHDVVPVVDIGKMVLNRMPENYFQEVEQSAFDPGSFVPGIGPSPDKMLQGRLFSYHDTHLHRLGPNYHLIPVNQPKAAKVENYARDGFMRVDDNGGGAMPYWPNTFGGPAPGGVKEPPLPLGGNADWHAPYASGPVDYEQPRVLYEKVMDENRKAQLVHNLALSIDPVRERIKLRAVAQFWKVHPDLGRRLSLALKLDPGKVESLAALTQKELEAQTCT